MIYAKHFSNVSGICCPLHRGPLAGRWPSVTPETPLFDLLRWDSGLFGFPVARLRPAALSADRVSDALEALRHSEIRLAYAIVPWADAAPRRVLEVSGAQLVDRKIRFRQRPLRMEPMPNGIEFWSQAVCPPALESLALASGHLSRFRVDPRVPRHVFPQLYLAWIRKSVSGEMAEAVLVACERAEIAGMVTLSLDRERAEIGLLAVDEARRGKGWGGKLMTAAEGWAASRGAKVLEVVTQGANTAACALYQASGGVVAEEHAVYHVWMKCSR
jgi:dTDP-4-amino-4,6-dideoxy-D-galactose acyltransferase